MLYLGNDINFGPDPMLPNHNLFHVTNAGWLWGFDRFGAGAKPISAKQAYVRSFGNSLSLSRRHELKLQDLNHDDRIGYTITAIEIIRRISQEYGAHFLLFVIPLNPNLEEEHNQLDLHLSLFADFNPLAPKNLTAKHYQKPPRRHFNNAEHALYADSILGRLRDFEWHQR